MYVTLMKSKIHRARVTDSNINYMGSITIDEGLMHKAGILKNEKVHVLNINNGNRFETYAIPGERGKGSVCLNGAAARLVQVGDMVIIISYALFDANDAKLHTPVVVFVDEDNRVTSIKNK